MTILRQIWPPCVAALACLLLWEDIVRFFAVPKYVMPAPSDVFIILSGLSDPDVTASLFSGAGQTAMAAVLGFFVAAVLGIVVGTLLASVSFLRRGMYPLANLLQMVPIIALAPLLNIWFGYGISGVAASACIVAIFPVIASTVDGLRSVDPQLIEIFDLYGSTPFRRWYKLSVRSALPQICTGLRVAAGLAVIGAVVGELVSGVLDAPPLGAIIAAGLRNSTVDIVFAAVILSAGVGFVLFGAVSALGHWVLHPWHASTRPRRHQSRRRVAKWERSTLWVLSIALVAFTVLAANVSEEKPVAAVGPSTPSLVSPSKGAKPVKVRLQLNWVPEPEFGGIYAAQHLGFFQQEGLAVDIIKGGPGVASPQLVATGQVEFGVVSGSQVVTMRAQKAPVVAVYACFNRFVRGIVTHVEGAPKSLEDLWHGEGMLAVEAGLPFVKFLNHRFGKTSLRLVPSVGGLSQFKRSPGMAQAVFVFAEPVSLELDQIPTRIFSVSESGFNPYSVVVATNETLIKSRPDVVLGMQRALRKGWTAYLKDPAPTNRILAKMNPAMSLKAMNIAARMIKPFVRGEEPRLGRMSLARWKALTRQLVAIGLLKTAPNPETCFHNGN